MNIVPGFMAANCFSPIMPTVIPTKTANIKPRLYGSGSAMTPTIPAMTAIKRISLRKLRSTSASPAKNRSMKPSPPTSTDRPSR